MRARSKKAAHDPIQLDFSRWGWLRLIGILLLTGLAEVLLLLVFNYGIDYPGKTLRFLVLPPLISLLAFWMGGRYIYSLYRKANDTSSGMTKASQGLGFLVASLFGFSLPVLKIKDGKKNIKAETFNSLDVIGGAGWVNLPNTEVVLLESVTGEIRARGGGQHFVAPFEKVKEVATLQEQYYEAGEKDSLTAVTRDGIQISVRNLRYRYRLAGSVSPIEALRRDPNQPYPFSEQAVRYLTYNRTITPNGITSWNDSVHNTIRSALTDYLGNHTLDELTAPDPDPARARAEIHASALKKAVDLRNIGADLVWIDIGQLEIPDKMVAEERINYWKVKWAGDAQAARAYAEARGAASRQLGRAEAQAELLMSVVNALGSLGVTGDSKQHVQNLLLLRTAQVLEAMGEKNG